MFSFVFKFNYIKRYKKLRKKHRNIDRDCLKFFEDLEKGNIQGYQIRGLYPFEIYKLKIPSSDQKRGKRGGFRLYYQVLHEKKEIYLLYIHAKAEKNSLHTKEIKHIIKLLSPISSLLISGFFA